METPRASPSRQQPWLTQNTLQLLELFTAILALEKAFFVSKMCLNALARVLKEEFES